MNCRYCEKALANAGVKTMHENRCKMNPDKLPGTFTGKKHTTETKVKQAKSFVGKNPKGIKDVSSRTASKILLRMGLGCSACGWNEASLDIHHIISRAKGGSNDNSNLTALCPNCHRLTHAGKITSHINLDEQIGDKWKDFYYSLKD